jgi:hypothetical protein
MKGRFFDNENPNSVAAKLRRRRFQIFLNMLKDSEGPVTVLDIGGSQQYWDIMLANVLGGPKIHINLLNIEPVEAASPQYTSLAGDGRSLPGFQNKQFDIVFSNSTIEHVGEYADQGSMAAEVRRLGIRYYVQTPNRYFPLEPHSLFPFFQYLPVTTRIWMVKHFNLGWYAKYPDNQKAVLEIIHTRLMTKAELMSLFPEAKIYEEKLYGLVKSLVAYTPTQM